MKNQKLFTLFLHVGHIEGVSYLVLLLVAMPLKYVYQQPEAVLFTGYLHGFLFIAYCILLLLVMVKYKWSMAKAFLAFTLALLPLGTFWLHKFRPEAIQEA